MHHYAHVDLRAGTAFSELSSGRDSRVDRWQNNGVIALTRCANRKAGYAACFFLVVMGIFSKFAAALVAIPSPVLGGMTVSHRS